MIADLIADLIDRIGPAWVWVLLGLALMGVELIASGVFLVWLGLAALVTGLVVAVAPMPWPAQALMFSALSIAFVVLASRRRKRPNALNRGAQGLIGQDFRLDSPITDGEGRIKVNDTLWRVAGPDAPAGARVRVTGIEGTTLTVAAV